MALKGQKITIFEKSQNGQKSSKMVWDIKIAHFDPGSDGIGPGGCLSRIFFVEKIAIYGILGLEDQTSLGTRLLWGPDFFGDQTSLRIRLPWGPDFLGDQTSLGTRLP